MCINVSKNFTFNWILLYKTFDDINMVVYIKNHYQQVWDDKYMYPFLLKVSKKAILPFVRNG